MPFFLGGGAGGGWGKGVKHYVLCENGDCLPLLQKKKGKPGWKKRKHDFLGRCSRKFLGAKEHLKR